MTGPNSITVFRGTITGVASRWHPRVHPASGIKIDSWDVTLTAVDPLGRLRGDRRHGPSYPARELQQKLMHWGPCTLPERMTELASRAPAPIEWPGYNWPDYLGQTNGFWPVACYDKQQNVSALTVLRQTAVMHHALARPFYFPDRNRIAFPNPDAAIKITEISLADDGTLRSPSGLGEHTVKQIDASRLEVDGIGMSSEAVESITRYELSARYETKNTGSTPTNLSMTETAYERQIGTGDQASFQIVTDLSAQFDPAGLTVGFDTTTISTLFGLHQIDPITWSPDGAGDADLARLLLNPAPPVVAAAGTGASEFIVWHLVGAISSASKRSTSVAVFTGGTLRYDSAGWEATITPSVVGLFGGLAAPTLGGITAPAALGDVPAPVTVADYTKINSTR